MLSLFGLCANGRGVARAFARLPAWVARAHASLRKIRRRTLRRQGFDKGLAASADDPDSLVYIGFAAFFTHEGILMIATRRAFLKTSVSGAVAAGFPAIVPSSVFGATAPSNRITIGAIGVGRISRGHDMPGVLQFYRRGRRRQFAFVPSAISVRSASHSASSS